MPNVVLLSESDRARYREKDRLLNQAVQISGMTICRFWLDSARKAGISDEVAQQELNEYFLSKQTFPEVAIRIPGHIQATFGEIHMRRTSDGKKRPRPKYRCRFTEPHPADSLRL